MAALAALAAAAFRLAFRMMASFLRRIRSRMRAHRDPPPPAYTGPTMIGKAITAPPQPIGPGWIGRVESARRR